MGARVQAKRPITAKKAAKRFGVSERTIKRFIAQPRDQYLAESLSRTKPWEKLGISRATWYRRGKPQPEARDGTADNE